MNDDAPHNQFAARFTRQWNSDVQRDQMNANRFGTSSSSSGRAGWITVSGWAGFGGLLGFAIGAISAHDRGISTWSAALSGALSGFLLFLAITLAVRFFFKGLGLGFAGITAMFSSLAGFGGGFAKSSAFGGLPRSTLRGGAVGGVLGALLAFWLDEPLGDPVVRLASFGAAAGAAWRLFRLTMGALKRDETPR